jgi:hypothetical protein
MRLKILGGDEIDALYAHPRFTHEERVDHFALSPAEVAALEQLHSIKSKIFFILQLGYFKARHMFFIFDLRELKTMSATSGKGISRIPTRSIRRLPKEHG